MSMTQFGSTCVTPPPAKTLPSFAETSTLDKTNRQDPEATPYGSHKSLAIEPLERAVSRRMGLLGSLKSRLRSFHEPQLLDRRPKPNIFTAPLERSSRLSSLRSL